MALSSSESLSDMASGPAKVSSGGFWRGADEMAVAITFENL